MQVLLGEFSWFFTFIIVFSSHLITSVHGEILPPPFLLGDAAINCGSLRNYTALDGRYWVGETSLLRPKGQSTTSTATSHKLFSPDSTPYLTARISFSYFDYNFHVNPGQKFVRLHFYPESFLGFENSQDFFTVKANSFTLVHNFSASLAADALGVKYVVKEYCLNVNETGNLEITFSALQSNSKTSNSHAFVNGIEIISMPTGLYYTNDDNLGARIVGQSNRFHYVDNSTALELVQRLNVGGGSISPVDDSGSMFRRWMEDVDYLQLQESGFQQIEYANTPPSVAPSKIYHTSRKLRENLQLDDHFTWKIHVDIGFAYLLRLHFCYFGVEFPEGGGTEDFSILIQNLFAETQVNAIQLTGGNGIPVYKDYLVMTKGEKGQGKHVLFIKLHSYNELVLGLLKGLEIFKLSNPDNSLASPNPSDPPKRTCTSSFWTLKIRKILVAFGQSNVIMTALTILLSILNSGVYQLRRIYECTSSQERNVESTPDEPSCHQFSLSEILLATQNFNEALVIGKGGFGKVYKGFIHGRPQILAIKRLKSDSKQGEHEFWIEIKTLSKLRHIHLVSLIGFCMEREEMIIVYEYMSRGTIADNLYKLGRNGKGIPLTWEQRLRICIGTARGLDYLHTGTQHGVIHRDVKDTNILLDENFVAKISDFGLSKLGKIGEREGELSTKVKGTIGYMDPDYVMTHKPSTKSDVYAFGIVLLVVLAGRPAVETSVLGEMQHLSACYRECVSKGEMNEVIDPGLQGDMLRESLTSFMETVGNCLHRHPKKRPTMGQVVVQLELALEKQIGAVPFTHSADTALDQSPSAGSNRPFELYELQVAPESITSLPKEGNTSKEIQNADLETRVQVSQSKGKDRIRNNNITQKILWGRPWVAFRNIRKSTHTKKKDLNFGTARVFSLKDIKLATQNFSDEFIIGKGSFGRVFKGFMIGVPGLVAIKRYSTSRAEEFRAEVEILSTNQYIHIVPFVGFCNEGNELIVVYSYMSLGSLDYHLYKKDGSVGKDDHDISLTWEQRLRICIGVARGLNYLHEVGVIHRDVNDHNILLDENFVAKISDFGLSKKVSLGESESHLSTIVVRNPAYLDPSYYFYWRLTKASDVYSFGILLLVVLSGRPAIDYSDPEEPWLNSSWFKTCYQKGNFDEVIDPKLVGVGGIPSQSLEKFVHLIKNCLHRDPKLRPVMAQVVTNLQESLEQASK